MEVQIKEDEIVDDLEYKNLKIIQKKKGFKFGMDAVLLSDFTKNIKRNAKVLDLGTGTGIISILLAGKTELSEIIGIEVQKEISEMATRSMQMNHLENRCKILNENIKDIDKRLEKSSFDVVVTNPPYKKKQTGLVNDNNIKLISRHEMTAELKDFISVASKMLKSNGELYMVHRPERLVDIMALCREYKLEPKNIRLVHPSFGKEPNLVLIRAVKNGGEFLKIEKPLYIYQEDGEYTQELLKIYGK